MANNISNDLLQSILTELRDLKDSQHHLEQKLDTLTLNNNVPRSPPTFSSLTPIPGANGQFLSTSPPAGTALPPSLAQPIQIPHATGPASLGHRGSVGSLGEEIGGVGSSWKPASPSPTASPSLGAKKESPYTQRVILTTYPGQVGIHPLPLDWGNPDPQFRGPVLASRQPASIKIRNAIGAHSGSYSIYKALAAAIGAVDPAHRPDYTNTEPAFPVPPQPSWFDPKQIVSMDPWGHLAPWEFKDRIDGGMDIRPTIAVTKAHLKVAEIDEAVRAGRLEVDGKIVVKSPNMPPPPGHKQGDPLPNPEVEVDTSKAAVEPVWYLPGVAERFGISEGTLRRALFEDTGGMYPELLTRHDLKVYLPPIGGLTVYIFGKPEYISDESKELTLRVHDECNGSDVFGSDICTCRPYLLYGIEEAVKTAQRGGVGIVIYFRKEGRALGEVTKYLVYNARKRGGDTAATYFQRTENIAGVKDMRFQALMPDVLHWLGIKKIDNMISMSDMKHDAIVKSGIPIIKRYDIPDHMIPPDGSVEIQAKIAAGYFSSKHVVHVEDLSLTKGRDWEPTTPAAVWEDLAH